MAVFSGSAFNYRKMRRAQQDGVCVNASSEACLSHSDLCRETPLPANRIFGPLYSLLLLFILASTLQVAVAQQSSPETYLAIAPLTAEQVVQNLADMNHHRRQALQSYQGRRTYRVEYRGFPGNKEAEMVVDVSYRAPGTKEFTIQSTTGSKMIIDKVFKKLMEAEEEALTEDAQRHTALSDDNYSFTLVGTETTPSGSTYLLAVEPKRKDKFLYRGRIWVDSKEFAVVRLEAEPARNPSFWTKKAKIQQLYTKVNDFWLPASNHSVTAIRLGGRAELTITYIDYRITNAGPVGNLLQLPPTRAVDNHPALSRDTR